MNTKLKNIVLTVLMAAAVLAGALCCMLLPKQSFSLSERRVLAKFPELSAENILSGDFSGEFELYAQDHFPGREGFRSFKALSETFLFGKLDNNGLYLAEGHVSKLDYPMNEKMLDHAAARFRYLYDTYMAGKDMNIYLSVIPDKNYFLAPVGGRLHYEHEALVSYIREKTDFAGYIDLLPLLSLDNYYRTDSHWRQERLLEVASELASAMGASIPQSADYRVNALDVPFYGVYSGQSALPIAPDTIRYLTSSAIENCVVTSYGTGMPVESTVYNFEKAHGKDAYELFLSGAEPLVTIENPNAKSERELIIFRDSFGSSLAPLLIEGYAKITLVDIRYVQSSMLGSFIEFEDQDVLFLYSSTLLNNSLALR